MIEEGAPMWMQSLRLCNVQGRYHGTPVPPPNPPLGRSIYTVFHRPNVNPSTLLGRKRLERFHFRTRPPSVSRYSGATAAAFKPSPEEWSPYYDLPVEKPNPTVWKQYNKSGIKELFRAHAPHLDYRPYLAAAHVFPMRVNNYVVDNLIDWSNVSEDPYFKLVIPQPGMLEPHQLHDILFKMEAAKQFRLNENLTERQIRKLIRGFEQPIRDTAKNIRADLKPHPAGQKEENVPRLSGIPVDGMQHKYRETVLFFPSEAQRCHAYCTYCFRWAQFTEVGSIQQFKSTDPQALRDYIALHPQVRDVLFTGGDPMVMSTKDVRKYVEPLLYDRATSHLNTIRIGTKSLAYWPYRYSHDWDAKELLNFFEQVVRSGKHLSIQAHFTHPRELGTAAVQEAMRLIQMTGAVIRTQSPLIRGINDSAELWSEMWSLQTKLGAIPYYMFVERDTGAHNYFSVPLARAYEIFTAAQSSLPGTARSARGPSMSAGPGKVSVVGISEVAGEKVFVLKFLQARNPAWIGQIFFAKFDPKATWLDDLNPAFGAEKWFYEEEYEEHIKRDSTASSGQMNFKSMDGCGCQ